MGRGNHGPVSLTRVGGRRVCVKRVAVVGPNIPYAVGRSIYLDLNAKIQAQAMALSGNVTYLDPQEAQKIMDAGENRGYERPWELWKAKAMAK